MMKPSIFISRDRKRSKAFIEIIEDHAARIICESLLNFSLLKSTGLPKDGWIFFYSQTGVDFFLKQHSPAEVLANKLMIASFGPKTGKFLVDKGLTPNFIGTGEAKSTAALFLKFDDISNVCFIKGRHSKESLTPLLEDAATLSSINVYDNSSKEHLDIPTSDILVFTSPLNLETYYSHYALEISQKVVTIGISTAVAGLNKGIEEVHIPDEPSLESLAILTAELCETWSPSK